MPYKKGEFFFKTKSFLLDNSKYSKFKDQEILYESNVHIKYQTSKIKKGRMMLFNKVLAVFMN